MKNYLCGVCAGALRHFWFFIGRFVGLSLLLIAVSTGIRGTGETVLGRHYYYLVMPGVVCHETGHALGCLLTGRRIVEFAPFKPHGNVLGYVRWDSGEISFSTLVAAFLIGTGPLWFGCLIVWLLSIPLVKKAFPLAFKAAFWVGPLSSGTAYWTNAAAAAWSMLKIMRCNWSWRSPVNLGIAYLLVCVVSEMPPSLPDLRVCLPGFLLLAAVLAAANLIPPLGRQINRIAVKLQPFFFSIHVVMLFVLFIDLLVFVCFALPVSIIL